MAQEVALVSGVDRSFDEPADASSEPGEHEPRGVGRHHDDAVPALCACRGEASEYLLRPGEGFAVGEFDPLLRRYQEDGVGSLRRVMAQHVCERPGGAVGKPKVKVGVGAGHAEWYLS
jgi:hypothetical protein